LVMTLLAKYETEDFASHYLYLYSLSGLCKNLQFIQMENTDDKELVKESLIDLMSKYNLDTVKKKTVCTNEPVK